MGRKKSYDRDVLIAKATEIFRENGFAGTSAHKLVQALGVNRYSLYAEFGSKQGLFDVALARYNEDVVARNFGRLEAAGAGIDAIRALLQFYGSAGRGPAAGRGCLLCNTAVEFGPDDPSGAGFVRAYFDRLSCAFRTALGNARAKGELGAHVDVGKEANFFTAFVLGLFVQLRANVPPVIIENAAQVAIDHLEALRAGAGGCSDD